MPAIPLDHAVSGTLANVAAYVLFYPLDIVRVRQQLSDVSRPFLDVVSNLVKEEGPTALYKGVGASAFSVAVSSAIYFFCFKRFEEILAKHKDSNLQRLVVAFVAGCVNATLTCPLWVASQRLKSSSSKESNLVKMISKLYRDGEMFQGLGPSIVLCTNPAIQFCVYEALRSRVLLKGGVSINPLMGFLFGAVAKALATVFTYPLQVVQTRSRDVNTNGRGVVDDIWSRRGFTGFFDGLNSKLTQTVSNSAFIFMFYEAFLRRAVVFRRSTSMLRFTVLSSLILVLISTRGSRFSHHLS